MSEIFNYSPEFVSADELELLANFYRDEIAKVNREMEKHLFYQKEREELRKKKFLLMRRKWHLLGCIKRRAAGRL